VSDDGVRKIAHWLPMSSEFLADAFSPVDVMFHPWNHADRPHWPEFVLLPRVERARVAVATFRERISHAVAALRGEWPDDDWDNQ